MSWWKWVIIVVLAYAALAAIALAFMRGAKILKDRAGPDPDEHEGGLPL